MATTYKLSLTFSSNDGDVTHSSNYADPDVEGTTVNNLATTIINNAELFAKAPTALKSAKIVTTETDVFDISDWSNV